MKRLLIGITLSEIGGGQKVVYDIISNLPQEGYDITLVTAPGGELLSWVGALNKSRENEIHVIPLASLKRNISPVNDLKCLLDLYSVMRRGQYDIAHFHSSKMGILGRVVAKIVGIPRIYHTVHGWCMNKATTGVLYGVMCALERLAAKLSTGVVFVSSHDQRLGINHHWAMPQRSYVIPNGICDVNAESSSLRREIGAKAGDVVMAFTARLAEPKEPMQAIAVAERLVRRGLPVKLAIIGDGVQRASCDQYIREHGLGDVVTMMGKRNDVRALLSEADIFMLLSKWEGLPIAILEAMDAGLPVVASRVGGIPELVEHGECGYLVEHNIIQIAGKVEELISDPKLRTQMGAKGQRVVREQFNLERMMERYLELYAG